jgi:hypothetical protein
MYSIYCNNQATSLETIEQCKKTAVFAGFLEVELLSIVKLISSHQRVHQLPICRGLSIGDFLIKPVQVDNVDYIAVFSSSAENL